MMNVGIGWRISVLVICISIFVCVLLVCDGKVTFIGVLGVAKEQDLRMMIHDCYVTLVAVFNYLLEYLIKPFFGGIFRVND